MKIDFQTPTWEVQTIEDDLEYLKNSLGYPCEFQSTVNPCKEPRCPNDVAIAFYGSKEMKTGIPVVEINSLYFEKDQDDRILILLHELIHCCQRINELKSINNKYMIQLSTQINLLIDDVLKIRGHDIKFNVYRSSLLAVSLFSSWIFEIWDEILLLKKYPTVFERKLELTFERIDQKIDSNTFKDYGDWAQYSVFINLVRALYLKKITKNHKISKKYEDLYEKWKQKLESITTKNEFDELMTHLDSLTYVEGFEKSDTSTLEKSYDLLIKQMVNAATKMVQT